MLWQCYKFLSLHLLSILPRLPYLCIFLLPDSSSLTWMQRAWPHHNFALPALPSRHFLILPPNGCSDAVSRPQIYAFGVSHCLAFPSSSHHMSPSSLSLALILYFWDSICTALTDGRVIFTLSDTHIHTVHMYLNTVQTFKYTVEMKDSLIKLLRQESKYANWKCNFILQVIPVWFVRRRHYKNMQFICDAPSRMWQCFTCSCIIEVCVGPRVVYHYTSIRDACVVCDCAYLSVIV